MPTNLGPAEILVILVVALIVLGPKRLPEAGKQVGKALAEVRRWSRGIQTEIRDAFEVGEEPPMVSTDQVTAQAATVEATATMSEPNAVGPNAASASRPPRTDSVEEVPAPTRSPRPPESPEPPVASNGSGPPGDPPRN